MEQQRKITDEREARRSLAAAEAVGGTIKQWARANGIDGRSLNAWRMNLARRGAKVETARRAAAPRRATSSRRRQSARLGVPSEPGAKAGPMLVELVPTMTSAREPRYVVRLGEVRVELGDDFDPRTLRRLLEVLRAC